MQIRNGTYWLYVGGEDGFNLVHMITLVEETVVNAVKVIRISTCSLYDQEGPEYNGHMWEGPLNLFLKAFKPLGSADEAGV